MSLVAYGSSDDSGSESDNEADSKPSVAEVIIPNSKQGDKDDISEDDDNVTLFSALPKPKSQLFPLGDENKLSNFLLNKKTIVQGFQKKEPVKISIPALADFDDGSPSQPQAKKFKPSTKGAGLFSILPPPKNAAVKEVNRSLLPNAIMKRSQAKTELVKASSTVVEPSKAFSEDIYARDDDFFEVNTNYLGIEEKPPELPVVVENDVQSTSTDMGHNSSYNLDPDLVENSGSQSVESIEAEQERVKTVPTMEDAYNSNYAVPGEYLPVQTNTLELDEKALQILCGGKKKRQQIPMNIIDVSGEEIMPDSKEWLIKQLTEQKKQKSHSHRKHDGPSTQQRRKHQITYLAFQAKEQELELQNQWANNRMSRKQTQSKYGF